MNEQNQETKSSINGPVPCNAYTVRFLKGETTRSQSGLRMIRASAEIIMPDLVDDPFTPGQRLSVAGRRATMYMIIDPQSKVYDDWKDALGRLGLIENGELNEQEAVAKLCSGGLCAEVVLKSEPDYHYNIHPVTRRPVGEPIKNPRTGEPILKGHRIAMVSAADIQQAVETPDGLPAVPKGPF